MHRDGEVFVDVDTPAEDYNYVHDPKVATSAAQVSLSCHSSSNLRYIGE